MITLRFDPKDPADTDSFTLDFSQWLTQGDTIGSASVTINPPDMMVLGPPNISGGKVSVWLQGGTVSTDYTISFTVTTQEGRHDKRSAMLFCDLL